MGCLDCLSPIGPIAPFGPIAPIGLVLPGQSNKPSRPEPGPVKIYKKAGHVRSRASDAKNWLYQFPFTFYFVGNSIAIQYAVQ